MLDIEKVLRQFFGYDAFRPGQRELIGHILSGRDVLGVMPTGAGKSICYQLPALVMEGVTLVVSPLISLMKDQVSALCENGIRAAYVNSSLTAAQQRRVLQNAAAGQYQLMYVAPERMETGEFAAFAQSVPIAMVTVDEAHCISQWGQDFRPSYRKIHTFVEGLSKRPILSAFTATATEKVRQDIEAQLHLQDPYKVVTGFDRPNLRFSVEKPKDKLSALTEYLDTRRGASGIVYCATRKTVDEVADHLERCGYRPARYHAGMADPLRVMSQEDFVYDRRPVMVATNAFGMGIDKSNVSFVVHYNMPKNMEGYYQEAGRAGRDGSPADCLLFYSGQDVIIARFLIEKSGADGELAPEERAQIQEKDFRLLREMTRYCQTHTCLRRYILGYFGESAPENCGSCGNCLSPRIQTDVTAEVRAVLNCVYLVGQRFGAGIVSDILRGSSSARVRKPGFEKLKTFGALRGTSAQDLQELILWMVETEYLVLSQGQYPTLSLGPAAGGLTPRSQIIMHRMPGRPESAQKPSRQPRAARLDGTPEEAADPLFDKLRELRNQIAARQKVPAYIIFTDVSLRDMCRKLPLDDTSFLSVTGVGQAKLTRYGADFMKIIREHRQNASAAPQHPSAGAPRKPWSREEDELLRQAFFAGEDLAQMALRHGRTPGAVRRRLEALGLRE